MSRDKRWLQVTFIITLSLILAACATQPEASVDGRLMGFFKGLLDGFLILFSLIASIFMDVRVYSYPNAGFFYDLGFFFGASSFLGGSGAGACKGAK
ncbi:MAG: hypothetical protein R3332_00510 [Pseudohongiellaceae bacterium]|nr:hypothetical protein [Pseudohongiellaceae bacterium]